MISVPALQFKGTGWYVTDYGRGGKTPATNGKSDEDEIGIEIRAGQDGRRRRIKTESRQRRSPSPLNLLRPINNGQARNREATDRHRKPRNRISEIVVASIDGRRRDQNRHHQRKRVTHLRSGKALHIPKTAENAPPRARLGRRWCGSRNRPASTS